MKHCLALIALLFCCTIPAFARNSPAADPEAAYTQAIHERADKIVDTLGLTDAALKPRVRDLIAQQYRDLRAIHDPRDAAIKAAKEKSSGDKKAAEDAIQSARDQADKQLTVLHTNFLAKLSRELTPAQVDQVKDGLTYGVVNVTYNAYMKMYPDLTAEQKGQLKSWLVEAREIAMDQGSSREKHAVFGKYKGRINNYLSKAGYDLKKGQANLRK
jgi:hypothetical protein